MKNLIIALLFLILIGCASPLKIAEKENEDKGDIEFLIDVAQEVKAKNYVLSEQEISSITAKFDSLCEKGIRVPPSDSLEEIVKQVDQVFILDSLVQKHVDNAGNHRLAVSYNELKFHLLVKTQAQMQKAYKNFEEHQGFVFDIQISKTLPLIQINQKYSEIKTNIIKDLIGTLSFLDSNVDKQRCWIAIERMLHEIDVKKSEFGYKPFQRSAAGIFTKKDEIINLLKTQITKETDYEVKELASKIIQKFESRLVKRVDRKFRDRVALSREIEASQRKTTRSQDFAEKDLSLYDLTAAEWFEKGYYENDEQLKIDYYSNAIERDPEYAAAYNNRANAYQDLGQNNKALQDYSRTIQLDPDYAPAFINRGNVYQTLGNFETALRDYSRAIELEPLNALAHNYLAMSYKNLNKFDNAIVHFGKAIELDPCNASVYNNRGDVYRRLGKDSKAIQDYDKAIEFDPQYAIAYNNRGMSYKNLSDYDQAIRDHTKAVEITPNFAAAYYNLGCVYWIQEKWQAVIDAWEKCLEINPHHEKALEWLPKAKEEGGM